MLHRNKASWSVTQASGKEEGASQSSVPTEPCRILRVIEFWGDLTKAIFDSA